MTVLLTGATGLLGGAVLYGLLSGGHEVRVMVRENSPNAGRLAGLSVKTAHGDTSRAQDVRRAAEGVRAVVHVAGIEHAPAVVAGLREAGVERLVAVSSTSAHSRYPTRSGPKLAMERVVRESGLAWSIVRPAMIYGTELDKNVRHLLRFLDRSPVFPVFGDGSNLFQPVYYADCAAGVVAALDCPAAVERVYDLPGARPLAYADLVRTAAGALGRKVRLLRVPLEPVRVGLSGLERLRVPLPFGSEQVERLREDKAYPFEEAARDLGYSPRPFEAGVVLEVERLREVGYLGGRAR
ncbi:Nucleoside-diphosphate-sugar epimerase [Rubrobacter radiotolerans]|uniref:NAD(P)H-binding protein n=1 Tax=Rubrobacter radiotolerans TaxID=42256 RepID=A0A023X0F4_RUBRA|nr:NAD(P)H-binding protein [Rubrobacter radiotolerans]AHY45519.1 Nucleoside-diphosphate-sugar epimerase [Rubrobacter radiotolerans]MDX5892932.1 NAD(P)H-binding protein [Rubrobacter radiotolerans]SMC02773.1 Nucleoside-diphosphate-sugar epimerase [Rubrobacter radiotolerans DSM 5868]